MKCILIIAIVFSSFSSFSQQSFALETQLTLKENKFFQRDQLYSGQVIYLFDNGQQKSIVEIKDGVSNGKTIEFLYDKSYQKKNYQDSVEIRKLNSLFSEKKLEIESNIQDTLEASKKEKDFLNYEIGGYDKLVKLKEKNNEGKLNQKKKEEFDKYEELVQAKNKMLRKLKDSQQSLIELNQKIREETNKPNYLPKKAKEYAQTNQLKEGAAIIYDSLGNKFAEGNYSNGKQNGEWVYYYGNGSIQGKGKYLNGNETEIGSSGVPRNGRQGIWMFYFENGNKESEGNFENGKLDGKYISYFKSGKINSEELFANDKNEGLRIVNYESGNPKFKGNYISGKENGLFVFYNSEGIKSSESNYVNGEKNGKEVIYGKDGKILQEYSIVEGVKNGVEKEYYSIGKLKAERNFKMGKNHGKVKSFYESGKVKTDADFQNGKQHGLMITYFDNGKIESKANYDTTSLAEKNFIGDVYQYNEDGSLKFHGYAHKDGRLEDKTISIPKPSTSSSSIELKKAYKCKCCKATINGLSDGVDKDGREFNEIETTDAPYKMLGYGGKEDFYKKLGFGSEDDYYRALGFNNIYDYLRNDKYKFCTMKCARTCYEKNKQNPNAPLPIGGYK